MFPEDVITISKKGKREVRNLLGKGKFIIYNYLDPETGKGSENKKRLILKFEDGHVEEFFIIPTSDGKRNLMLPAQEREGRKIWDGSKAVSIEDLFLY